MKRAALLVTLLYSTITFSQRLSTKQLINYWKAADTSQTTKAEYTYSDLKRHQDKTKFRNRLFELYTYLKDHNNQRLLIRTWMYEVLGKAEFGTPFSKTDKMHLQKALKMAGILEDDQLLSELFSLYARLSSFGDNSYYVLRSLEIQEKIGMAHFPLFYLRLLNFSINLYNVGEYRACIQYGKKAIELLKNIPGVDASQRRILQLDYIGASYKELKMPDSVGYYYKQILHFLPELKQDTIFIKIWEGIAKGGLGYKLLLEKKYEEAKPYLEQNIASSVKYNLLQDAAIAKDALGQISYAQKDYKVAVNHWRTAYKWYANSIFGKMGVSKRLSKVFRDLHNYDSSIYYYQLFSQYKIQLHKLYNREQSESLQSRIEFNKMEAALQAAKKDIGQEKNIRLFTLSALCLLSIIILLIYNRRRIKTQYVMEQARFKQKMAELEVKQAREQIRSFTEKIKQSEELIEKLKATGSATENTTSVNLETRLLEYTLVTNDGWDNFRLEFIKAYPSFFPALQKVAGVLTPAEQRLVALIHLQLNNAQIASSLGIAKDSVARSKRRLKIRFKLAEEQSLELFLMQCYSDN